MNGESPRLRLSILGICIFSLFAVLLARLYYLQVLAPDQGLVRSSTNRVRTVMEEAPRGRIVDAKGRVLVDNRRSLIVTIDRSAIEKLDDEAKDDLLLRIARQLTKEGVPTKVSDLEQRLADPQFSPLQPVPVASDVPEDLMVHFAEQADDYPGIVVKRGTVRQYPYGTYAAHVLGYVRRISDKQYTARMGTPGEPKKPPKPYAVDSSIGQAGVEATMEDELRGTPGEKQVEVDARGRVISVLSERPPVPGNDVQLTLDIDIQQNAEDQLKGQLDAKRGQRGQGSNGAQYEGKAGSTVIEDPRDGNIIAMASYPTYDPTEFVDDISENRFKQLGGNDNRDDNALLNRAISEQYPPGSTFKLVTAYAALSTGLLSPTEEFNDTGSYILAKGQLPKHNAESTSHGPITVTRALTVSSDVFFYWLGNERFGSGKNMNLGIQNTAKLFGLGSPTGIQLPNEAPGRVPDPRWKADYYAKNYPGQDSGWYGGDSANLAVGQGDMLLTPLQLTNMYATFANHGTLLQPNLVLRILSTGTDGSQFGQPVCDEHSDLATAKCVVRIARPAPKGTVPLPPQLYDPIHKGLDGVTKARDATATQLFQGFNQDAFPIFGKTGTIENDPKRADNSTFVGVGPANDPQYVINSYLEHMGYGADGAGPVVRSLFNLVANQQTTTCAPTTPGGPTTTGLPDQTCPAPASTVGR